MRDEGRIRAALSHVATLHRPEAGFVHGRSRSYCVHCSSLAGSPIDVPCPTMRLIAETIGGAAQGTVPRQ